MLLAIDVDCDEFRQNRSQLVKTLSVSPQAQAVND